MATDGNSFKQKLSNKYYCEICDYGTCRKSNMDNHYRSLKHINSTDGNTNKQIKQKIKQVTTENYTCEICKKCYKDRTGLWKHKSKGICIKNTCELVKQKSSGKLSNIFLNTLLYNVEYYIHYVERLCIIMFKIHSYIVFNTFFKRLVLLHKILN